MTRKITPLFLLPLLSTAIIAPVAQAAPSGGIAWRTSFRAAQSEAKRTRKPLMVVFSAAWCPPCQMMKKQTFVNKAVVAESKKFVSVYLDTDKAENSKISENYKVQGIPTIVFMRPDGSAAQTEVGYIEAKTFVKKMREGRSKASQRAISSI